MPEYLVENGDSGSEDKPGEKIAKPEPPEELDDAAIVDAVKLPAMPLSFARWFFALIVIAVIIVVYRYASGAISAQPRLVTMGGRGYAAGDVITVPFDAVAPVTLKIADGQTIEVQPGARIVVQTPRELEQAAFRLERGKVILDMFALQKRVVIRAYRDEVGTVEGRLFVEMYGPEDDSRLRAGVYEGAGVIVTYEGEALAIREGNAVSLDSNKYVFPIVPPVNDWSAKDAHLEGYVFPGLARQAHPSVNSHIEDLCRQVGLSASLPDDDRLLGIAVPNELLGMEPVRLCDILDELARRCGFSYGIDDDELYVSLLDESGQFACIGDWVIFSRPDLRSFRWPDSIPTDDPPGMQKRLANLAMLSAAPLEKRVGALAVMIAGKREFGDAYVDAVYDFEAGMAFNADYPEFIRRIAFEDIYYADELPADVILPRLDDPGLAAAREFYRFLAWGNPPWADDDTLHELESKFAAVIDSNDDAAGRLYRDFATGGASVTKLPAMMEPLTSGTDYALQLEVARHLDALARRCPPGVDSEALKLALKLVFASEWDVTSLLALDGFGALADVIERDYALLVHIGGRVGDINDPITVYGAPVMARIMGNNLLPEDEQWIDQRIAELTDPDAPTGEVILLMLGVCDGLETIPVLTGRDMIDALESRLGFITERVETLQVLRILRMQRGQVDGATGIAWAEGIAGERLTEVLASKDPGYLVEAILSLGLTEPGSSDNSAGPYALRDSLNGKFIALAAHPDPRLRWLALEYIANDHPPSSDTALASLADDDFPAIAARAAEVMGEI